MISQSQYNWPITGLADKPEQILDDTLAMHIQSQSPLPVITVQPITASRFPIPCFGA
jgi:hypothetical protein